MHAPQKYREASPGLWREFTLYPEKLVVIGRFIGGTHFEMHIPLHALSPDYGYLHFRSRRCAVGFMLFAVFTIFLWLFLGPFQAGVLSGRVVVTAILAAASLGFGLFYLPKYKAYRFVNTSGVVVIDMIEAGPEKDRCGEFAEQIATAIREVGSAMA